MRLDHLLSKVYKKEEEEAVEGKRKRRALYSFEGTEVSSEELGRTKGPTWGCSSDGRAPALQAGGQRFEPAHLHQPRKGSDGLIAQLVRARA